MQPGRELYTQLEKIVGEHWKIYSRYKWEACSIWSTGNTGKRVKHNSKKYREAESTHQREKGAKRTQTPPQNQHAYFSL